MEVRKMFYSMGEVSELLDVNPSLIRYWESQFRELRPQKNKKGNRLFSPKDVETLKLIYHLVKERRMTLEGAKRCLKQNKAGVERDSELLERLQRIRALLVEVREGLKSGDGELLIEEPDEMPAAEPVRGEAAESAATEGEQGEQEMPSSPDSETEAEADPETEPETESEPESESAPELDAEPVIETEEGGGMEAEEEEGEDAEESEFGPGAAGEPEDPAGEPEQRVPGQPARRSRRGRPRKEPDAMDKELFAFYEQSLFKNNED